MNTSINRDKSRLIIGKKVMINAYKYNGWFYRSWEFPRFIYENKNIVVVDMTSSKVISSEENSSRCFSSVCHKKSYWIFFKKEWFNMRITLNEHGAKVYINLSSPFIYEESTLKYYDFDLDFKYFTNGKWREIDQADFLENSKKYHYPLELINIIKHVEKRIWNLISEKFFDKYLSKHFLEKMDKLSSQFKHRRINSN